MRSWVSTTYKLDADSRKLRGDVESRGPWSCSVPSAARTLLQGPRLSKTPRSFRESAWQRRFRKTRLSEQRMDELVGGGIYLANSPARRRRRHSIRRAQSMRTRVRTQELTSPSPKPRPRASLLKVSISPRHGSTLLC